VPQNRLQRLHHEFNFADTADAKLHIALGLPPSRHLLIDETLDPWPKGKLDPERYRDGIEARFRAIFELELSGSLVRSVLAWVGAHATQRQAADYVINAMRDYLKKAGL